MINMHNAREVTKYVNLNFHKSEIYMLDLHQAGRKSKLNCQGIYVPSREEVLQQLGISKEQDEEMQQKYK